MSLYDSDADLTVMWQWNIAGKNRDKDVELGVYIINATLYTRTDKAVDVLIAKGILSEMNVLAIVADAQDRVKGFLCFITNSKMRYYETILHILNRRLESVIRVPDLASRVMMRLLRSVSSADDLPYSHISLRVTPPQQLAPVDVSLHAQEESEEKVMPYHMQSSPPNTTLWTSIYVIIRNGNEEGVGLHILEVDFVPQK
ncbi:hypothetical protein ARMGADRAFT_1030537 [Armillaria gallica]|uniref:Uncharacterized protein n=1 Tax=Armillaria gallica TaxID=47427 RepID=A0A2H3DH50_ARMGA|nr:hypothetical protein ARMGADRAFT_1030537 [Armillaria gallica]